MDSGRANPWMLWTVLPRKRLCSILSVKREDKQDDSRRVFLPLLRVETSAIAALLASLCGLSTLTRFSSLLMLISTVMLLVPSGFGSATSGLACSRCLLLASCASVATSTWCPRRTGERRHQHGRRKEGGIGER